MVERRLTPAPTTRADTIPSHATCRPSMEHPHTDIVAQARHLAAKLHAGQRRKGALGLAYVTHCEAVVALLEACGITDPITLAAAWLHDAIEDTPVTDDTLRATVGEAALAVVHELTDDMRLARDDRRRAQITKAATLSPRARLIKIADKTCNLRDVAADPPRDWTRDERVAYARWGADVVARIRGENPHLDAAFDDAYAVVLRANTGEHLPLPAALLVTAPNLG